MHENYEDSHDRIRMWTIGVMARLKRPLPGGLSAAGRRVMIGIMAVSYDGRLDTLTPVRDWLGCTSATVERGAAELKSIGLLRRVKGGVGWQLDLDLTLSDLSSAEQTGHLRARVQAHKALRDTLPRRADGGPLGATALAAWAVLIAHADDEGRARPSRPRLARLIGRGRSRTTEALGDLAGLIHNTGGHRRPSLWAVLSPQTPQSPASRTPQSPASRPLKVRPPEEEQQKEDTKKKERRSAGKEAESKSVRQRLEEAGIKGSTLEELSNNSSITPERVRAAISRASQPGVKNPAGLMVAILRAEAGGELEDKTRQVVQAFSVGTKAVKRPQHPTLDALWGSGHRRQQAVGVAA